MEALDKVLGFAIKAIRAEEEEKVGKEKKRDNLFRLHEFHFEIDAKKLVKPCWDKQNQHREREEHYTAELEKAEKDLRETGISMEVVSNQGYAIPPSNFVCSGQIPSFNQTGQAAPTFQPRVDQKKLDACKYAKDKMLEHRDKSILYSKWAQAFTACPEGLKIDLYMEDVAFFGLGKESKPVIDKKEAK